MMSARIIARPLRFASAARFLLATTLLLAVVLSVFAAAPAFSAEVKNDRSVMDGNRVRWDYDLDGEAGKEADVTLTVTVAGKVYQAKDLHLEGDIGKVMQGKGKSIRWNVLQDFPRGMSSKVEWELLAEGASFTESITGMEFVFLKGGCYQMGDTFGDGDANEKPVHEVCVGDLSVGKTEVTRGQFGKFVKATNYRTDAEKGGGCHFLTDDGNGGEKAGTSWRNPPRLNQTDAHPVACMSHNDAVAFSEWMESQSGKKFRLPTEAEWEYAARSGGKSYKYSWGDGSPSGNVGDERFRRERPSAWKWDVFTGYDDGYGMNTAPVGSFKPNELGLYDMTGNVWEWCSDWYGENYYASYPKLNPQGPSSGPHRVLRGGSWIGYPWNSRAAWRGRLFPDNRRSIIGFRLVVSSSSHD